MPLLHRRKQAIDESSATAAEDKPAATNAMPSPAAVAHFVTKAQLAAAKRGDDVKSLCGTATIKGDPPTGASICQACVLAQLAVDDTNFDKRVQERHNEGLRVGEERGIAKGRADSMREIREAAEQRARELQAAS